jgi:hypothetical protein
MEVSLQSKVSFKENLKRRLRNLPVVRAFAYNVPPYLTGSVLENRLGLQVCRLLGKHLAWRCRKQTVSAEIQEYMNILERDGVLVISDFLAPEDFRRVKDECEAIKLGMPFQPFRKVENGSLQVATFDLDGKADGFSAIRGCLQENPLIQNLACTVIRRQAAAKPSVRFSIYHKACAGDHEIDNDVENILHADLHTPTVKAFYYMNDVDESNGAFVYVKGSHRVTLNRIRHEYNLGLFSAKLRRGDEIPQALLAVRGPNQRVKIADKHMQGLQETTIGGRANTLVIANNMGFHRRGEFTDRQTRETLLINFRHFEKHFQVGTFLKEVF